MNSNPLRILAFAALICPVALAQQPEEKPLSESELLKQLQALSPSPSSESKTASAPVSLFDTGLRDEKVVPKSPPEKKSKGPTEITALEATFDQKANLAVFIGDVVVKDPEFNVTCDRLTAHLKQDEKKKPAGAAATPSAAPKTDDAAPKKKGGGLEKAIAESTTDRRVVITQDKLEADGTMSHSIGKADKATYDATTGDIILTGSPEVLQNINKVVATDPSTVMTLNRDGRMRATGPHKTTIVDKGELQ